MLVLVLVPRTALAGPLVLVPRTRTSKFLPSYFVLVLVPPILEASYLVLVLQKFLVLYSYYKLRTKINLYFLKKSAAGAKIFNFIQLFNKNSMKNFKFFKILDENRLIPRTHTRTRTSFFNPSYLVLVLVP